MIKTRLRDANATGPFSATEIQKEIEISIAAYWDANNKNKEIHDDQLMYVFFVGHAMAFYKHGKNRQWQNQPY